MLYLPKQVSMFYAMNVKEKLRKHKALCMIPQETVLSSDGFEIPKDCHFPQETIDGLAELCEILRDIRHRLISEGYVIIDGKFYSPKGELVYERHSHTQ